MAKKKQAPAPDSVLVTAAKTIGAAAGKMAVAVGVATPPGAEGDETGQEEQEGNISLSPGAEGHREPSEEDCAR